MMNLALKGKVFGLECVYTVPIDVRSWIEGKFKFLSIAHALIKCINNVDELN